MREPALLPHRVLGVVREHLDAAFRHLAGLDPRHRERRGVGAGLGADRALERRNRPRAEARLAEPAVPGVGVGHREGRKLDAGMARERGLELAAERRVGGLEQHLDVAARHHRADIAGAGRAAVGRDLHRYRRRRKAGARERRACGLLVAHEMADMVEKNLVADRQLTISFCHCDILSHKSLPLPNHPTRHRWTA